ncbi:unnamed protein product [Amoebophrya sp. A25]|nr:unnamed protein product [Amoebophrya sp. A25]|eukprot:GSA25T00015129001.1
MLDSSKGVMSHGELWADFVTKQVKIEVLYSTVKTLTVLVGSEGNVYTSLALKLDDTDGWGNSAGQTKNTCAINKADHEDASTLKALARVNREWSFAGAHFVNEHECLVFRSPLSRSRVLRIFVEDTTSSRSSSSSTASATAEVGVFHPRLWRIEVESRDGTIWQTDVHEHLLQQTSSSGTSTSPAEPSSTSSTSASWKLKADTFEPLEQWGCKDFAQEAKVLHEQGLPLPAEHEYEDTIVASAAHRKSLALLDAQTVAASTADEAEVPQETFLKLVLALPGEVEILSATPLPPELNHVDRLEFDYESTTHRRYGTRREEQAAYVGFVRSTGHLAMNVNDGLLALTGDSLTAVPGMGKVNASVILDTAKGLSTANVEWTEPQAGAQCLVEALPGPGAADVERLKEQAQMKEKFLRAVVLEDDATECNLFYLEMSKGRFLHMLVTRSGELVRLSLFSSRHPDRPRAVVKFSNWRRGGVPRPELFETQEAWHCHKSRGGAEGRTSGSSGILSESGAADVGVEAVGPKLHERSGALRDSIFSFSKALGQYRVFAIPFLSLPGELDLLAHRPPTLSADDLSFFEMEFQESAHGNHLGSSTAPPKFRGRFAVNFARKLLYLSGHDPESGRALRVTMDGRHNSGRKGVYIEYHAAPGENYCFAHPLSDFLGEIEKTGQLQQSRTYSLLHFAGSAEVRGEQDRMAETFAWDLNLGNAFLEGTDGFEGLRIYVAAEDSDVMRVAFTRDQQLQSTGSSGNTRNTIERDATATLEREKRRQQESSSNSLFPQEESYFPGSEGTTPPPPVTEERGANKMLQRGPNESSSSGHFHAKEVSAYRVLDMRQHPGKFDFRVPRTCKGAIEDAWGLLESPLDAVAAPRGVLTSTLRALAGTKRQPPLSLVGVPLEWPRLAEHLRNSCAGGKCSSNHVEAYKQTSESWSETPSAGSSATSTTSSSARSSHSRSSYEESSKDLDTSSSSRQQPLTSLGGGGAAATEAVLLPSSSLDHRSQDSQTNALRSSTEDDEESSLPLIDASEHRGPLAPLFLSKGPVSFDFNSVRMSAKHGHEETDSDNENRHKSRSHGHAAVDMRRRILYLESSADALQSSATVLHVRSKLLIEGHTAYAELTTKRGQHCVKFEFSESSTTSGADSSAEGGFNVKTSSSLLDFWEDTESRGNPYPNLRRFRGGSSNIRAYTDKKTQRVAYFEATARGVHVVVKNWRHGEAGTHITQTIRSFDKAACMVAPEAFQLKHWPLAELFVVP